MKSFVCGALAILAMKARSAYAFPEMVRHGYVNCTACHMSLGGGGLLNEYGRSLSRELLSQTSFLGQSVSEGGEKFAYGLVRTPSWLQLGVDARLLQTFKESKEVSSGRFLIMQLELDASANVSNHVRLFAAIGRVELRGVTDPTAKDFISSPRHGVELLLSPIEAVNRFTLRVGRFMPTYGIDFAEHTFVTRKLLEFQPGQERYASELAWVGENATLVATAIHSRIDSYTDHVVAEKGGILQVATGVGEKSKVGANCYQTQRDENGSYARRVLGAFAEIGLSKSWYALLEVDRPESATQKWGLVDTFKLGYEIHQGLHLIGVQEYANLDVAQSNPKFDAYSVGVEWFPRPHWDLYALYRRERDTSQSDNFQDVIWLIGHFYL